MRRVYVAVRIVSRQHASYICYNKCKHKSIQSIKVNTNISNHFKTSDIFESGNFVSIDS